LLRLATVFDFDDGLSGLRDDLERKVLQVRLDFSIVELAADEALGIEDGVVGVHGDLIFCGVSDEALRVGKGDIRGCCSVALVIGDDFWRVSSGSGRWTDGGGREANVNIVHTNTVVLPYTDAGVGGAEIDTDSFWHSGLCM
jgi:hypothetical protein